MVSAIDLNRESVPPHPAPSQNPQLNSTPSPLPLSRNQAGKNTDTKTINKGLSIPGRPFRILTRSKENHYEAFQPSIQSPMSMLPKVHDGNQEVNPESSAVIRLRLRSS